MELEQKKKGKSKVKAFDIVSWILIFLFLSISAFALVTKYKKGTVYLFNNRYDVVLTGSMSKRNEEHQDFLEGTTQIQQYDLVRSKKVDKNTKLDVYDVVLFQNPMIGTDMHRIVDKRELYADEFKLEHATIAEGNKGFYLPLSESLIHSNAFPFKNFEMQIINDDSEFSDAYYVNIGSQNQELVVNTVKKGEQYAHTIKVTRDTSRPAVTYITHKYLSVDYSKDLITYLKFDSTRGNVYATAKDFSLTEEVGSYEYRTNIAYEYEIRGDAAKDADGWFTIDSIYSKVNKVLPKMGYVIKYLTSTWGIIMFVGLTFIIIGFNIAVDYSEKKEKAKALQVEENVEVIENNEQEIKEEETKDKNEKE